MNRLLHTGGVLVLATAVGALAGACGRTTAMDTSTMAKNEDSTPALTKSADEGKEAAMPEMTEEKWREKLTADEYRVLRKKGTERAFTGKYWDKKDAGLYACAGCGQVLFRSDAKYESGCGWPSFWEPVAPDRVVFTEDLSHGMRRTEVTCSKCGGHQGHIFDDGPPPTGKRFCINSVSLDFKPEPKKDEAPKDRE